MNGKRVKELRLFVEKFYPEKVGDKGFMRFVKNRFKAVRGKSK